MHTVEVNNTTLKHMTKHYAQVTIQPNGNTSALALRGTKEQIEATYNLLFNFEVCNGDLEWGTDNFAFVWSTTERLERGFTAIWFNRLCNSERHLQAYKGVKGGFYALAKSMAAWHLNRIKEDRFLTRDDMLAQEDFSWVSAYMYQQHKLEEKAKQAALEAKKAE